MWNVDIIAVKKTFPKVASTKFSNKRKQLAIGTESKGMRAARASNLEMSLDHCWPSKDFP